MADLLQSAVLSGTGAAAQIGRPVAGKTGTTTLNKDGWFIGFSSGLTTGVWMGRDDAKPVRGLYGGTAPAKAFHDFMTVAVANRPPEPFETQVPMPTWQLTPEEELFGDEAIDQNSVVEQPMVDENGNPIPTTPPDDSGAPPSMVRPDGTGDPSQQELDEAFPPASAPGQPVSRQPYPGQPNPRQRPAYPNPQQQPVQPDGSAPPPQQPQSRPYSP